MPDRGVGMRYSEMTAKDLVLRQYWREGAKQGPQ